MHEFLFFIEVLVGGLLSGIMYSLVALGFVLIYKASSVFNFAQGAMVFFAVLTFVGVMELGLPFWAALPVTVGVMVLVGMATERFVLRPLVSQSEDTLADGDDRPFVRHRGRRAARMGRGRAKPRSRHPGRADQLGDGQDRHADQPARHHGRRRRARHGGCRWRCCFRAPRSAAACAR